MTRPCGVPLNKGANRCCLSNGHTGECRPPIHRPADPAEILAYARRSAERLRGR